MLAVLVLFGKAANEIKESWKKRRRLNRYYDLFFYIFALSRFARLTSRKNRIESRNDQTNIILSADRVSHRAFFLLLRHPGDSAHVRN